MNAGAALEEIFQELFYGSGFWLGFILITAFALGISYRYKYSGVIFEVVLFFMALEYFDNIDVSSNYMWGAILCFIEMVFIGIIVYSNVRNR
ncbi:MAG: hypothetical protein PHG61_10715 [Candidatus Marinimicrobia bacterium]|nr:hypothetical protein [Candidatus Neomarinimicrobiota bacterium]